MKKCYFAHPVSQYGTDQEKADLKVLRALGFAVCNPNHPQVEADYQKAKAEKRVNPMTVFAELIAGCDLIAFRAFRDGRIGAGVGLELDIAFQLELPILELPQAHNFKGRTMAVHETQDRVKAGHQ